MNSDVEYGWWTSCLASCGAWLLVEAACWVEELSASTAVKALPYMTGRKLLTGSGGPTRSAPGLEDRVRGARFLRGGGGAACDEDDPGEEDVDTVPYARIDDDEEEDISLALERNEVMMVEMMGRKRFQRLSERWTDRRAKPGRE